MIALEDCIALCGLTEEEVLAIAEHEHLPEIVACALAEYLLHEEHGPVRIRDMIVDDLRAAQERGNREHVRYLAACAAPLPQSPSRRRAAQACRAARFLGSLHERCRR